MYRFDNALRKGCECFEYALGGVEMAPFARGAIVDDGSRDHFAVIVKVYFIAALSISSVLFDREDF